MESVLQNYNPRYAKKLDLVKMIIEKRGLPVTRGILDESVAFINEKQKSSIKSNQGDLRNSLIDLARGNSVQRALINKLDLMEIMNLKQNIVKIAEKKAGERKPSRRHTHSYTELSKNSLSQAMLKNEGRGSFVDEAIHIVSPRKRSLNVDAI